MTYKKRFPFKIGSTSYVLPDNIVPNVQYMSDFVDDIELLFFESFDKSPVISNSEIAELRSIAADKNISYSVHCPIDIHAGSADKTVQEKFVNQIEQLYDATKTLNISGYIVHLDGISDSSSEEELKLWHDNVDFIGKRIGEIKSLDRSKICIENLGYNPRFNLDIVNKHNFSFCLDMGHFWLNRHDWKSIVPIAINKTRVIHLHGVHNDKDHRSLKVNNYLQLNEFLTTCLADYANVVTIELFNKDAVFESLEYVKDIWERSHL
jgi:sugar phosphate isomerase/epimerase